MLPDRVSNPGPLTYESDARNLTNKQPSLFGTECRKIRKKWHSAKYRYKYNKNENSKIALKQASKLYKKK